VIAREKIVDDNIAFENSQEEDIKRDRYNLERELARLTLERQDYDKLMEKYYQQKNQLVMKNWFSN
jgi:hypothetical protein